MSDDRHTKAPQAGALQTMPTADKPLAPEIMEQVLAHGNLGVLTAAQRVQYVVSTCNSLGLNWRTRPFRFIQFKDGGVQMYATKDCTEQLRSTRNVSLKLLGNDYASGIYTVHALATLPNGRTDEDIGSVTLAQSGDSRANGLMRAVTKAKRRVTLSICGLGNVLDESELDTIPGHRTFDAEDDTPPAQAPTPVPPKDKPPTDQGGAFAPTFDDARTLEEHETTKEHVDQQATQERPPVQDNTEQHVLRSWLMEYRQKCGQATTREVGAAILTDEATKRATAGWQFDKPKAWQAFEKIRQEMIDRLWGSDSAATIDHEEQQQVEE